MPTHHLGIDAGEFAGNDELGRYVFLPGSRERALRLAQRFERARHHTNPRGLDVHIGQLRRGSSLVDVAAVSTGMGCPSIDIVVGELLRAGARRLLRVGTAGPLGGNLKIGTLVIASGAVRDEGASDAYVPRAFPAAADPLMVQVLCAAAQQLGLADATVCGVVHTKDSFFGREFGQGPDGASNQAYVDLLARAGVVASEMEAAHLFILGATHGGVPPSLGAGARAHPIRCGAVLAIVSGKTGFGAADERRAAEDRMLDLASSAIVDLADLERT